MEQLGGLQTVMKYGILGLICLLAFCIRLFAVVRYESVIHEFDPYFNFRTTKYLAHEGFLEFLNWFDDRGWYPLGRTIGGTIYPGLMLSAATLHWFLNFFFLTVNIRDVCVFLAPLFSGFAAVASYLLTTEVTKRSSTGLLAAAFTAIVPSYISRSVGGSYDNEGVAIFALIFTFYLWVKAVNTGSLMWACFCALSYYYMVAAWGGYVFIINIIPIYVLIVIAAGRYSSRLYIAYSCFYTLGSLMAMTVPFVGFNVINQVDFLVDLTTPPTSFTAAAYNAYPDDILHTTSVSIHHQQPTTHAGRERGRTRRVCRGAGVRSGHVAASGARNGQTERCPHEHRVCSRRCRGIWTHCSADQWETAVEWSIAHAA